MGNFNRDRGSRPGGGPNFKRGGFSGANRSFDRPVTMFSAVCDECGNSCKVPFQPSGGKPIYCSSCFGEKKGAGRDIRGNGSSQPNYKQDFESLNNKVERILQLLEAQVQPKKQKEAAVTLEVPVVKKAPKIRKPKA